MTVGMALTARPLVLVMLGDKWAGAISALEMLAMYASIRSIATLLSQVLTALRQASFVMWVNLLALVILPTAFYVGSRWGIAGIAAGWIAGYPVIAGLLYRRVFRSVQISVRDYLRAIEPATICTSVMVVLLLLYRIWVEHGQASLAHLMQEVALGAFGYAAALVLLYKKRLISYMEIAGLKRRAVEASA